MTNAVMMVPEQIGLHLGPTIHMFRLVANGTVGVNVFPFISQSLLNRTLQLTMNLS